jgi:hypothetical protein
MVKAKCDLAIVRKMSERPTRALCTKGYRRWISAGTYGYENLAISDIRAGNNCEVIYDKRIQRYQLSWRGIGTKHAGSTGGLWCSNLHLPYPSRAERAVLGHHITGLMFNDPHLTIPFGQDGQRECIKGTLPLGSHFK